MMTTTIWAWMTKTKAHEVVLAYVTVRLCEVEG